MTKAFLLRAATAAVLVLAANLSVAADGEDRDDDTLEKATPINLNEDVEDALNEAGDVDYWQFEMPGRGTVTAQTTGTTDTFGQLLTGSGFNLGEDDDGGSRLNFLVTTSLGAGTYYVRVSGIKDATGAYTLRVSSDVAGGAGSDRNDDTMDLATPLLLGEAAQDAINEPGDLDWWKFDTRSQGVVEIETIGDTDTLGTLFNDSGEELRQDNNSGEGSNFLIETTVPEGTYFVLVSGNRGSTGPYTVEVNHSPGLGAERPNLRVEAVRVSKSNLTPRESFTLRARVRNHGEAESESTVLRYFRSSDSTITTDDELLGSDPISRLDVSAGEEQLIDLNAPNEAGVYYYGGCVRRVAGENRTDDNCSGAVRTNVTDTGAGGAIIGQRYALPLVLSTANPLQQGFVRLINRSDRSSTVRVYAIDDAGMRFDPFDVQIHARETVHFNSDDLEIGNTDKGLAEGVGDGQGEWRLDLVSDIDLLPLAYVRTSEGFLTSMQRTASVMDDGRLYIPFFNPGSNTDQVSRLRLLNSGSEDVEIGIAGLDDKGATPPGGNVSLMLPAGEAREISAQDLEAGAGLEGEFGDGSGKWRLFITASEPIEVMSLLESPTGNLTNLSARGGPLWLPLVQPASNVNQPGFVRIINHSDRSGEVRITAIDDAGVESAEVTLSIGAMAAAHFNSEDLESGNAEKGLPEGVGAGEGSWRLRFATSLSIEALAYIRTSDGFVTPVHGVAEERDGRVVVPFLNPASNTDQRSRLRIVNRSGNEATITITGEDDAGQAPPGGDVGLTLASGASREISAFRLESGGQGLNGRFSDGFGKWQVFVEADRSIGVMSLLESPTGHLTDLSAFGGEPLGPTSDVGAAGFREVRLEDFGITIPSSCPLEVDICVRDHLCEDGDRIQVSINGSTAFSGELLNTEQCVTAAVSAGSNTIELQAVNGAGTNGLYCSDVDANVGQITVTGGNREMQEWSLMGGRTTRADLFVTEGQSGNCRPASANGGN